MVIINSAHSNHLNDLLDSSCNMLERLDAADIDAPTLLELTGVTTQNAVTASGVNEFDYQNVSCLSLGHKQLSQIQSVGKVPIPTEILEHFKHLKCHCMMGLFPEINRAWLTIDSHFYVWTYDQQLEISYFDGLSSLIVSVGLIKARPGIFIDDIKYLLVLATALEIVIMGISFMEPEKTFCSPMRSKLQNAEPPEMQIMTKPIFILNSENVPIKTIKGSEDGRIFLGGRDGNLYEIIYSAEAGWFGNRCRRINLTQTFTSFIMPTFLKVFKSEIDPLVNVVIDEYRKILYTLSEKGNIDIWDMGTNVDSIKRVHRVTEYEITQAAATVLRMCKSIDPLSLKPIRVLVPLKPDDFSTLHLMAVTQCGVRLYFTTKPMPFHLAKGGQTKINTSTQTPTSPLPSLSPNRNQQSMSQSHLGSPQQGQTPLSSPQQQFQTQQPQASGTGSSPKPAATPAPKTKKVEGLFLVHVRVPPGYSPTNSANKPKNVHLAYYDENSLIMSCLSPQDQAYLWTMSSIPFTNRHYMTESTTVIPLDDTIWGIAELGNRQTTTLKTVLRKEHHQKTIVLLTNQGVHILALLNPSDILLQILTACNGPHHDAVKSFFQIQTDVEACVICLAVACSKQNPSNDVVMWASQAFMLYGGEPCHHSSLKAKVHPFPGPCMMTPGQPNMTPYRTSPKFFMSTPVLGSAMLNRTLQTPMSNPAGHGLSPIQNPKPSFMTQRDHEVTHIVFSARHDALYIYAARLMRPIWKTHCINENLRSALSLEDCCAILDDLYGLKSFLEGSYMKEMLCGPTAPRPAPFSGFGMDKILQSSTVTFGDNRNLADYALVEERRSLCALAALIKNACEVIGLWKILCEHRFSLIIEMLPKEQQDMLVKCTFRELILMRVDCCPQLIVALVNTYLEDNTTVTPISTRLREVCPVLYRHEDAVTFKATEILMNAKLCENPKAKQEMLQTALQLCKSSAPNLPLQNICQQFINAGFYEGVVELTSACAAKSDPEQVGIHFYNALEPSEDREGFAVCTLRKNCYKDVRLLLDHLLVPLQPTLGSPEPLTSLCSVNRDVPLNKNIVNVIKLATQLKDPLLHVTVYEWLMGHDMVSSLLEITVPTLGEFLRRNVVRNPDNLKMIDLLWKYYEKNGHHAQAARILDSLSSTQNSSVDLVQRTEYLARAVICMRNDSIGFSMTNGVLLKELEDKLEIARVQKSILDSMLVLPASTVDAPQAIDQLNRTLFDITELYQNFADRFNLWECKLTILNCSHHNDPLLIENVWRNIIKNAAEGPGTNTERGDCMFTKIETLFKRFNNSGHCFPLPFLIHELEVRACQLKLEEGIVPIKLSTMNLDMEMLLELYSRMICMNERVWTNEGNEWQIVQSSIHLLNILTTHPHSCWHRSKRRISGKAQDIISTCLNQCYQKPNTERLQQSLKELQSRIQRTPT